ncbi:uncharacterized protein ASCRUDRAFT_79738 [Ascoidea rubescens DSM 1968]|uniref:Uncharacterized protein n=1 Tax=Ascoidea rubescens DSM 1968 TaxID=1344418 RepID=A0A1D2VNM4_9ASCO|nr:hypothetical protein ASCRUDRAFT_79738 [Ascoidea rubescens DSM 1968]ODV63203.1 hypothetical protein ASCRUDRAFT_79738 [Ascoidea rubescens DSM 1968]
MRPCLKCTIYDCTFWGDPFVARFSTSVRLDNHSRAHCSCSFEKANWILPDASLMLFPSVIHDNPKPNANIQESWKERPERSDENLRFQRFLFPKQHN